MPSLCVHACVRVRACVYVFVCVRACVRACVCVCVCDFQDLMITIHDNKCYYTAVTEDSEHYLSSDRHLLFFSSRDLTEVVMASSVWRTSSLYANV